MFRVRRLVVNVLLILTQFYRIFEVQKTDNLKKIFRRSKLNKIKACAMLSFF